jgi:C4-dicarboxylate-specific signal transduction histidine kinase
MARVGAHQFWSVRGRDVVFHVIAHSAILVTVMIPALTTSAFAQPIQETTRILMIYAHDPNAPGVASFAGQLKGVVRAQIPTGLEIYDEYLDLGRFPDPIRSPQLARYFAEKYRSFTPDAIVAAGAQALRFAIHHLKGLFPNAPIVYGLAFEPVVDFSSLPANVTGRRLPLPFASTYTLARALHPEADRVVLVGGASPLDSLLSSEALQQITPLLQGMELAVWQNWSYAALLDSLRQLPPRTFVLLSSFRRDQRGQEFNSGDLIASLTRVSSVPMYGIARNWIGDGVVGGSVMDFGDDGTRTGRILLRVLARAPREPMPATEVAVTRLVVDWRQLQRWGLSEDRLPPGTEVLFRTASAWARYRTAILAVLGLLIVESLLIALLLVERTRRMRAQRAVEEQVAYERMMRALTADMVRRPPAQVAGALGDALPKVARFAGASAAILVVTEDPTGMATCLVWTEAEDSVRTYAGRADVPSVNGGDPVEIPLIVDSVTYGMLELQRAPDMSWPAGMATRLGAVGDLIAGALARARADRALEQTRGQVEHMARVATVSGLAAAVSHELRQPLTAIRMNAEAGALFLARTPPEVDEARLVLREIVSDDVRASEVIDHFRALLRRRDPVSTAVDLNEVCRKTARILEHEATERRARLVLRLDPEVPLVRGDPVQLQQVLINLTLNALDAVSASAPDREAAISTAARNGHVEVQVSDTGPGLSPDVQQRLFEPFFSTKQHGLGMGLAIVRSIVERHHGILRAGNRSVGGALFTVTLPAE